MSKKNTITLVLVVLGSLIILYMVFTLYGRKSDGSPRPEDMASLIATSTIAPTADPTSWINAMAETYPCIASLSNHQIVFVSAINADGTVEVLNAGKKSVIALANVEIPVGEDGRVEKAALSYLQGRLKSKTVLLLSNTKDGPAHFFTKTEFVTLGLVQKGLSVATASETCPQEFADAQATAQQDLLGIWSTDAMNTPSSKP